MIVILRVIRWQTLHGPGYLQQRFAPRSSAGANLFFQQLVQFQIYSGELIPVQLRQLSSCVLICSLLSNCLQLAARVQRINSLPLALSSSPASLLTDTRAAVERSENERSGQSLASTG